MSTTRYEAFVLSLEIASVVRHVCRSSVIIRTRMWVCLLTV